MVAVTSAYLASRQHTDAILLLLNEYSQDTMGNGTPLSGFTKANLIPELRKLPHCHIILAFVCEEPAGMIIAFANFSTFACKPLLNIHDVIVAGNFRKKGISRALFQKAEELATTLGCCKLTLEVLEGNTPAKNAYESFGYSPYELDPKLGRALFYEKKLS
ncbi:MAG: GNAT family N-acetyltransferase [Luteolibacter sp.]